MAVFFLLSGESLAVDPKEFEGKSGHEAILGHAHVCWNVNLQIKNLRVGFLISGYRENLGQTAGSFCGHQANDKHVSSKHFRIYRDNEKRFFLEDLGVDQLLLPGGIWNQKGCHRLVKMNKN